MSTVECHLEFAYESREVAQKVLSAVELENYPYVNARINGNILISEASTDSLESLIHTMEDYLSCIAIAESMLAQG